MSDEFMDNLLARIEQTNSWKDAYWQSVKLIQSEDYNPAIKLLKEADKMAVTEKPLDAAMTAERLAFCLHRSGQNNEAEAYYRRAMNYCLKDPPNPATPEKTKSIMKGLLKSEMERMKKFSEKAFFLANREIMERCLQNYGDLLTEQNRVNDSKELERLIRAQQDAMKKYDWPDTLIG